MRRRWIIGGMTATAFAAALSGSGCSILPTQSYLERRDWPLAVRRAADLPINTPGGGRSKGSVLLVRQVQAGPGMDTPGLQTLQRDGSLQTAYYERWAVPPAQGIDDDLRRWLEASGLFAAVITTGSRVNPDLVLESELEALNADLATMTARAALSLVLSDQRGGAARILLQKTATATVKLEGTDPPALARAQLAAVEAMLRQTETDLANALHP